MNFLAHAYLSGNNDDILIGNFIADAVKGNHIERFREGIRKGIRLHREIDTYTDQHEVFLRSKHRINEEYGKFSGVIIDIYYDHFLAKNWTDYSDTTLRWFAKNTHSVLLSNFNHLPVRVQGFLPFLIQHRRLESYASIEGIVQAIKIMGKYSSLPSKSDAAMDCLMNNYNSLENNFNAFMAELIQYVSQEFDIELNAKK